MWIARGFFYQMIPKNLTIFVMLEWAGATFVKLTKLQAWQELVFVLAAISNIESREKASKIIILMVWWQCIKEYALLCVYSDICHQYVMLHQAINYLSVFGYFLVCSVINYVIFNAVKHQIVTKTLNKEWIALCSIKCLWHISEYTHSKAYSFIT